MNFTKTSKSDFGSDNDSEDNMKNSKNRLQKANFEEPGKMIS